MQSITSDTNVFQKAGCPGVENMLIDYQIRLRHKPKKRLRVYVKNYLKEIILAVENWEEMAENRTERQPSHGVSTSRPGGIPCVICG